jgi:staphylococcal nuclease domain-containing protein 1
VTLSFAGIHGNKEPTALRINDVSAAGSGARAKQYLPFFQRAGKVPCVVEHVISGSRVRLFVPKVR